MVRCTAFVRRLPAAKWKLKQRFARVTGNRFPRRIADANDFVPIRGIGLRKDRRTNRDCDASAARQPGAVAEQAACSVERHRYDGLLRGNRAFECAEVKRANPGLRGECSFGKNEYGFPAPEGLFDFLRLL